MNDERVVVDNSKHAGRQRRFNKFEENKGGDSNQNQHKKGKAAYGNSYGRKGQTNNNQIITNDNLRASMWQTNGFIVDKNLSKLGRMLLDKNIDCIIPDT